MRKVLLSLLAISLLLGLSPRLRADDAKAVIEKAVKAHGGEEKLTKLKAVQTKAKGTVVFGVEVPVTVETVTLLPNQFKMIADFDAQGTTIHAALVLDGDKGWAVFNGASAALDGPKLDDLKAQLHVRRLMQLTPLLKDDTYRLAALDEIKVEEKPAVGVAVTCKGQRDVRLYFDKETHLLVKIERLAFDDTAMKDVPQEEILSDYKTIDGVPTALKQVTFRGGKKGLELTFTEVRYPEKIDAREFAKPGDAADTLATVVEDVAYGHKFGVALTMDVFTPKKNANGAAVVVVMSGGWVSGRDKMMGFYRPFINEFVKRGYTTFAVYHGAQPQFTIPDAVADINRAVRYIRQHAKDYAIDPERIGISGGSAGGHLSLMQGVSGDKGDPKAKDPVEATSSRVQTVACFYPPTDFLNYGAKDKNGFAADGVLAWLRSAVDVRELDPKTLTLERISDDKKLELLRKISPITHVKADGPPTLIIHGDKDVLVPLQQAEVFVAKLKDAGGTAELVVKKGAGHGWPDQSKEVALLADWFDKYLKKQ